MSALVGHTSGMDMMLLMDDTAAVAPSTYSDCRLIRGVHNPLVVTTKKMSESVCTEVTLNVYLPAVPWLTPTHVRGTQVADPSQATQYDPRHTCCV